MRFPPEVASLLSVFRCSFAGERELAWKIYGPTLKDREERKKNVNFSDFKYRIRAIFYPYLFLKLIFTRNSSIFRSENRILKHFLSHPVSTLRDLRKNGGATKLRNRNKFSTTQQRLKREFTIPWRIELFGFLAVPVLNGERVGEEDIKWRQCWEFFGTGSPDSRESTIFSRTADLFLDARRPKNRRVRVFLDRVFAPLELLYRFLDYPSEL